jgi:hypothetical protein
VKLYLDTSGYLHRTSSRGAHPHPKGRINRELYHRAIQLGLKPGNPDGTYIQKVPLVGITSQPNATFTVAGKTLNLKFPNEYVASSSRFVPEVSVKNSDVVFVGYGVVAPEYGWDDYKGVDVKNKTIVMLINDPPVPDPQDPSRLDEKMFRGRAMTYYGRWTYKFEIASKKGAAAAVIIHETVPAGYPYEVVENSWSQENFDTQKADKNKICRRPVLDQFGYCQKTVPHERAGLRGA